MQSTEIKAIHKNNLYGVILVYQNSAFAMKFDTGACDSIISLDKIIGSVSKKQRALVKAFVLSKEISPKVFHTANGSSFTGYPTYMQNVLIGNCVFEKFYYYLVIDKNKANKSIALIGDDFIDCCEFTHKMHGNIEITSFDFETYSQDTNCVSTDEIYEIIQ